MAETETGSDGAPESKPKWPSVAVFAQSPQLTFALVPTWKQKPFARASFLPNVSTIPSYALEIFEPKSSTENCKGTVNNMIGK